MPIADEYWWKSPSILIEPSLLPKTYGIESLINFATKMLLLITLFGTVFYLAGGQIASSASIATLIYIISIQLILNPPREAKESCQVELIDQREGRQPYVAPIEGFSDLYNSKAYATQAQAPFSKGSGFLNPWDGNIKVPEIARFPTQDNPFMNMSVTDILDTHGKFTSTPYDNDMKYDDYFRVGWADQPTNVANSKYDDYFRVNWFSDPNDVFGKSQSQRQYYTMPSNSVPNDRDSYQKWLYGGVGACKAGENAACVPGSTGGHLPWN